MFILSELYASASVAAMLANSFQTALRSLGLKYNALKYFEQKTALCFVFILI